MQASTGGTVLSFGGVPAGAASGGISGAPDSPAQGGRHTEAKCAATKVPAKDVTKLQPADIIFAIDSSASMAQEIRLVQAEMNRFSQQIVNAGIDVRVLVIGKASAICIGAPLGSGRCPDDTLLPNYAHIDETVGSHDALSVIVKTFPLWRQHLRPDASKSFVVVSDDDATALPLNSAEAFSDALDALDPTLFAKWTMNGVYCFTHCSQAAAIGTRYATLVERTMGVGGDLCLQDFQPVFDRLAKQVVTSAGAQIACEWPLQPPVKERSYAGELVQVTRTSASAGSSPLNRVSSEAACGVAGGWYFDSNLNPTEILACPSTCMGIQNQRDGAIEIDFGCEMVGACVASGSSAFMALDACDWSLPVPPPGQALDLAAVNVRYTSPSGFATALGKVEGGADCATVVDGWYYDSPMNPTKIVACPQTCTGIRAGGQGASVEALFGCTSVPAIPR